MIWLRRSSSEKRGGKLSSGILICRSIDFFWQIISNFSYRLISKVSTFIFDLWNIQFPASMEESRSRSWISLAIRETSVSMRAAWLFMSVVQPGEVSMTSVADSRTARGVFNSWDTAAIKFFWLCMAFSVGFIACRMIRTDTNRTAMKTMSHIRK